MAILKIRNENGEMVPVPAIVGPKGTQGNPGKSAYEYARDGGYAGTEEEFAAIFGNGIATTEEINTTLDELIELQNSYIQGVKVTQEGDTLIIENGGDVNA